MQKKKRFCPHTDLNPGLFECENGASDHLAIETIFIIRDILSNKYLFYFKGQFLRPRYAWVLGGIFFLIHLFNLLYAKPSGNSTHIVPTCYISRIFACFLSSCLISTYSKVIFWLPKIWALGSWNAKIDWNPCLPITLDCFKLEKWKSILTVWSCSGGRIGPFFKLLSRLQRPSVSILFCNIDTRQIKFLKVKIFEN